MYNKDYCEEVIWISDGDNMRCLEFRIAPREIIVNEYDSDGYILRNSVRSKNTEEKKRRIRKWLM